MYACHANRLGENHSCIKGGKKHLSVWSYQSKGNCLNMCWTVLYIVIQRVMRGRQKSQKHTVIDDVFENPYNLSMYRALGWRYCIHNCLLLLNFKTLLANSSTGIVRCGPSVLFSPNRREDQGFSLFCCPAVEIPHKTCQLSDQQTLLIKQWTFGAATWLQT